MNNFIHICTLEKKLAEPVIVIHPVDFSDKKEKKNKDIRKLVQT